MTRLVAAAALAFAIAPSPAFAQFGGMGGGVGGMPPWSSQVWSVKVETIGGRTVSGALLLAWVPVECDLGLYYLKPEKIKLIEFTRLHENAAGPSMGMLAQLGMGTRVDGAVTTTSGEEICGTLLVSNWTVATDLGSVTLDPSKLKSVSFTGRPEPEAEGK